MKGSSYNAADLFLIKHNQKDELAKKNYNFKPNSTINLHMDRKDSRTSENFAKYRPLAV